eukprot:1189075-Ditylum_brightwellii.AAC.1
MTDSTHNIGATVAGFLVVVAMLVLVDVIVTPLFLPLLFLKLRMDLCTLGHDDGDHLVILEHEAVEPHVLIVLDKPALDVIHIYLHLVQFDAH